MKTPTVTASFSVPEGTTQAEALFALAGALREQLLGHVDPTIPHVRGLRLGWRDIEPDRVGASVSSGT